MRRFVAAVAWAIALACAASAATAVARPGTAPKRCDDAAHHQFDFWLGTWDVRERDGTPDGRGENTRELNGCLIRERWVNADGSGRGESLNAYDPLRKRWHQTWISEGGTVLLLDGRFDGRTMRMTGRDLDGKGRVRDTDVRWTRLPDGRVEERWNASYDGGKTWVTIFDGMFKRVPPAGPVF